LVQIVGLGLAKPEWWEGTPRWAGFFLRANKGAGLYLWRVAVMKKAKKYAPVLDANDVSMAKYLSVYSNWEPEDGFRILDSIIFRFVACIERL
jgi:hypothetical protein